METLLSRKEGALVVLLWTLTAAASGSEPTDRHEVDLRLTLGLDDASSALDGWPDGRLSKLRFSDDSDSLAGSRLAVDYRGRLGRTVWLRAVADYATDASRGFDLTEAYLQWRPVPESANQVQWRFGAFYPPFSFENTDPGWSSPYTISYSAINTWLGEEIRPIGAEGSLRRRVGASTSPHTLRAFAAAFYGNDPAATLLFWRGWSLHDRQTRFRDVLPLPPMPAFGGGEAIVQSVQPVAEIDSDPGLYVASNGLTPSD